MNMMKESVEEYKRTKRPNKGINGISPLLKMNNFDFYNNVPVDPMHCLSGVIRNRLSILIGSTSKSNPMRQQEKEDNRFPHYWNQNVFPIIISF